MRWLPILVLLTACAGQPQPDPVATRVVTETKVIETAVPVHREPPLELMQPVPTRFDADELRDTCQPGDYGITARGLELLRDAFIAAGDKLRQWRAWATAPIDGETP